MTYSHVCMPSTLFLYTYLKSLHFKRSKLNVLQVIFGSNKSEIVSVNKYEQFFLHAWGFPVDGVYSS